MQTKVKKALPTIAVLAGTALGSLGGYYYHEVETNPTVLSISTALELVTGREAKAQAAYEASQAKLALAQEEVLAQEEKHRKQLAALRNNRVRAESSLRTALVESKRKVAEVEALPIPPHVVIPDDPEGECLMELKAAADWEWLAVARRDAIEGLQGTQVQLLATNKALTLEIDEEQAYRFSIERERDLWKERFTLADKRVQKLKGSRLKWTLGAVAGAVAGVYLSGR